MATRTERWSLWLGIVAVGMLLLMPTAARALITGGEGNEPIDDRGWPTGAAAVFNFKGRVAFWEGPPLGGGESHAECRGDAAEFNKVLADFAKIDSTSRRLIIHDGLGQSFWLNMNNEPEKRERAKIDWTFTIWNAESWKQLQGLPERFRPNQDGQTEAPPPVIEVYVGGSIRWADVRVPDGIEVVDERLEAHGFSIDDGVVMEGTVVAKETLQPLTAVAHLERIETNDGKYQYTREQSVESDAGGRWVLTEIGAGWFRVVIEAPTFAPRIAGFERTDGSPRWSTLPTRLVQSGSVFGIVRDGTGVPLADVRVRLDEVVIVQGEVYQSPRDLTATTGADGRFVIHDVPRGHTNVHVHKPGFVRAGLGEPIEVPSGEVALTMDRAATAHVEVDFGNRKRPMQYLLAVEPEGGAVVGTYGGTATLPESNTYDFDNVPAGRYVFFGRPNPGPTEGDTEHVTVELRAGETTTVTLKVK